jgi:hypothetical protein
MQDEVSLMRDAPACVLPGSDERCGHPFIRVDDPRTFFSYWQHGENREHRLEEVLTLPYECDRGHIRRVEEWVKAVSERCLASSLLSEQKPVSTKAVDGLQEG